MEDRKPWRLTWDEEGYTYAYFVKGKDSDRHEELFKEVVNRHIDNKADCLQVGIPHGIDREFGGEGKKFGKNFIAIDLYDQNPEIDYNVDLSDTPFDSDCFDFIVCPAILEHVKDPFKCVDEIYRILKNGGEVWCEVPFFQPFHPFKGYNEDDMGLALDDQQIEFTGDEDHGGDYWRFTPQGVRQLFRRFELIEMFLCREGGICFYGRKPEA